MRRPHDIAEVALKTRRARAEFEKHLDRTTGDVGRDPDGSACHCLSGLGAVRKNRPGGKAVHGPGRCSYCEAVRAEKRRKKKRLRAERETL